MGKAAIIIGGKEALGHLLDSKPDLDAQTRRGAELVDVRYDPTRDLLSFVVWHPEYEDREPGAEIPVITSAEIVTNAGIFQAH